MNEAGIAERIVSPAGSWPGVNVRSGSDGVTRFVVDGREIAHLHAPGTLDVATTFPIRNQLLTDGAADRHHARPRSSWVSYRVRSRADVPGGLRLLRLAYLCRRLALENRAVRAGRRHDVAESDPAAEVAHLGLSHDLAHVVSRTYRRPIPV